MAEWWLNGDQMQRLRRVYSTMNVDLPPRAPWAAFLGSGAKASSWLVQEGPGRPDERGSRRGPGPLACNRSCKLTGRRQVVGRRRVARARYVSGLGGV